MATREPDDAEVEARFASIVAALRRENPELAEEGPVDRTAPPSAPPTGRGATRRPDTDDDWTRGHPLFADDDRDRATDPEPTAPAGWREHRPPSDDELDDEPPPSSELPPWRPSGWAIAGIVAVAFSVIATLMVIGGVRTPPWLGWAALVGMAGGLVILFTRLPRHRDEEDDGARL